MPGEIITINETIQAGCDKHMAAVNDACMSGHLKQITLCCVAFGQFLKNSFPERTLEEIQKSLMGFYKSQPIQGPLPPLGMLGIVSEARIRIMQSASVKKANEQDQDKIIFGNTLAFGVGLFGTLITRSMSDSAAQTAFDDAKQNIVIQALNTLQQSLPDDQKQANKIIDAVWASRVGEASLITQQLINQLASCEQLIEALCAACDQYKLDSQKQHQKSSRFQLFSNDQDKVDKLIEFLSVPDKNGIQIIKEFSAQYNNPKQIMAASDKAAEEFRKSVGKIMKIISQSNVSPLDHFTMFWQASPGKISDATQDKQYNPSKL